MRRFVLVLILGLFLPGISGQQQKSRSGQGLENPQNVVTVTRKLISVIVTDKQGRPVTDLRREEFSLTDNGRAVEITEFENHTMIIPAGGRQERTVVETPVPKREPLLGQTYFLLFDFVFADPGGLRLAREAALRYFDSGIDPESQVAILSFSGGRNLNVLHPPGRNHQAARKAIEAMGLRDLRPIAPIRPSPTDTPTYIAGPQGTTIASSTGNPPGVGRIVAGNFIWALDALAQALRYAPGRKIIVLYSNGLHPSYLSRGPFVQAGNSDLGAAYRKLADRLGAANASVFTVDTEDNEWLGVPEMSKGVASLREISSQTGGRFLGDTYTVPDHLKKLETLTGSYYVLGYPIAEAWDGRFHRIRVKVTRPGCDVDSQSGYFSEKLFSKYSELEKQIHLVDLALSEKPLFQEPVRLAMLALPVAGGPPDDVQVISEIPIGSLADVAGPRVEAVTMVFDRLDRIVDTGRVEMDLSGRSLPAGKTFFTPFISVPPGDYRCRIVLRNMETGRAAVGAASTAVIAPGKGILIFPPLFLVPGSSMTFLEDVASKASRSGNAGALGKAAQRFARTFPADVGTFASLIDDSIRRGSDAFASIRCVGIDKAASLSVTAAISNAGGQAYEARASVISEKSDRGGRIVLLRLGIPKVAAGPYKLEIAARSRPDGTSSRVIKSITIE